MKSVLPTYRQRSFTGQANSHVHVSHATEPMPLLLPESNILHENIYYLIKSSTHDLIFIDPGSIMADKCIRKP